jgi:putative transcriptional regulator
MPANRVAQLRKAAGLTQRALAEKTGLSQRAITYIEQGDKSPSVANAQRIALVLGATVEDLFPVEGAA